MFKKVQAFFIRRKAERSKEEQSKIYIFSHLLLVLYNNLKMMKTIDEKQKLELFQLYIKTIQDSMKDEEKVLFIKAISEADETINRLSSVFPSNESKIKNELQEIFKSS